MTTAKIVTALSITVSAAALAGGCSVYPSTVPDDPTYERDVRPILMSRCVRCHGDPLGSDPTAPLLPPSHPFYSFVDGGAILRGPPRVNARFDKFEDTNCEPLNDAGEEPDNCFRGAEYFAVIIGNYVGDKSPLTMPPAPAPPLSKRERDTIIRWSQEMPPLER